MDAPTDSWNTEAPSRPLPSELLLVSFCLFKETGSLNFPRLAQDSETHAALHPALCCFLRSKRSTSMPLPVA